MSSSCRASHCFQAVAANAAATRATCDRLDALRLDAVVASSGEPAWPRGSADPGGRDMGAATSRAAVGGLPLVTVPCGKVRGLPVGITFMGRRWSEATLIGLAYSFEQATRARTSPAYRAAPVTPNVR